MGSGGLPSVCPTKLLATLDNSALISAMAQWFEAHVETTRDEHEFDDLRSEVLREVQSISSLRLVFVIYDIRWLINGSKGYALLRDLEHQ